MRTLEDIAFIESMPKGARRQIRIREAFDPARMVAWYNRMGREIQRRLVTEEGSGGNKDSAQKLRTFLNTWNDPKFKITASMNIEAFDGLAAAAEQYAKSDFDWKHHGFFASLYDNLAQAQAGLESAGMVGSGGEDEPGDFGGGAPGGDFGPQDEAPPGDKEAPPGAPEPDAAGNDPDAGAPDDTQNPEKPGAPGI
jgi:hypothetical protein